LIEEAELFFNCQPIHTAAMLRGRPQPGALPGSFEDSLALRVVHAIGNEDGGDRGGGLFDGGHQVVCSIAFGVQTCGAGVFK